MSEPAAANKDATKPSGGGRNNVVLLAVLVVNMLGMLGLGAYVLLGARPASAEEGGHGGGGHGEEEEHEPGPIVEIPSALVNLSGGDGRYLKVTFHLELADEEAATALEHRMVPVRDAVLSHLSTLSVTDVQGSERMEALRERLLVLINEALHGESVRRVYFTEYLVQ